MNTSNINKLYEQRLCPLHREEQVNWELVLETYPFLAELKQTPQEPDWHGEGNVWIHTQMVVESLLSLEEYWTFNASQRQAVFTAALFHDLEKRSTTEVAMVDGQERITAPGHAIKGAKSLRVILYEEGGTAFEWRECIVNLVRYHSAPLWAIDADDPIKRVLQLDAYTDVQLLHLLAKADILGRICRDKEAILLKVDLFKEQCIELGLWGKDYSYLSPTARFEYFNKKGRSLYYKPQEKFSCEVVMLVALAGSGKDYYLRNHYEDRPVLSLDDLRRKYKAKYNDKKLQGRIIQEAQEQARIYLRKGTSFVFNATNLRKELRQKWMNIFITYRARIKIVYLEVPQKRWLKQNKNRNYIVPDSIMRRMLENLEVPALYEAHEVEYRVEDS